MCGPFINTGMKNVRAQAALLLFLAARVDMRMSTEQRVELTAAAIIFPSARIHHTAPRQRSRIPSLPSRWDPGERRKTGDTVDMLGLQGVAERSESEDAQEKHLRREEQQNPYTLRQNARCRRHSECDEGYFCPAGTQLCKPCSRCTANGVAVDGRCPTECASSGTEADQDPPELGWAFVDNAKR